MCKKLGSKPGFDPEESSLYLSYAVKNLYLLRDSIYRDLFAREKEENFFSTGYLMECCDAMSSPLRELERIQADLDAIVEELYTKEN